VYPTITLHGVQKKPLIFTSILPLCPVDDAVYDWPETSLEMD